MRGQVLGVDVRTGEGQVAGDDGRRYTFRPEDWADRGEPAIGVMVDFNADESRALSIYRLPGTTAPVTLAPRPAASATSDRNKIVAALLAFLFGTLGVDRFYLGRTGSGIVTLILSITVIGLLVTAPLALINMIRYLVMSDEDFAHRYARVGR